MTVSSFIKQRGYELADIHWYLQETLNTARYVDRTVGHPWWVNSRLIASTVIPMNEHSANALNVYLINV